MIATIDMDPFVWLLLRIVFLLSFASRTLPARLQGKYEARLQGKYSSYAGINLPATPPPPNPIGNGNTPTLSITGILVIAIAVLFVGLILIALIKRLKKKKAAHNCNANSLAIAVIVGMLILVPVMRAREKALHNSNGNDLEAGADIRTYTEEQRVNPNENALEVGNLDIRTDKMEELNCLEEGIDICTYTREELAKATDNFTTKVGQGVSGFVYRANLPGNKIGAVKRATDLDPNLFKQELSVLLRLPRHPYLVDLIGLCLQPGERILVFKFISNGNLYDRLHTNRCVTSPLSWTARMDIAYQVSLALQYLHEEAKPPILHRDVKSANILLDDDNCAKLADFGLSKLGPKDNQFTGTVVRGSSKLCPNDNQFTSTAVRGSYGYMDPQYMKTQRFSAKSDVYSFGVLLLELITGLKSVHEDTPLAEWTETYRFSEDIERFMTIVDRNMRDHVNKIEVQNMIKIANLCLQDITEDRPSMREVLNMIQETRNTKENGKLLKGDIAPFLRHGNLSDGVATALSLNLR